MEQQSKKFSGSRVALLIGFGSLLAIMALSGADALRVLRQFRRQDDQIRHKFLLKNRLLNDIRSEVYLSGTYLRDYLLEPDPERASASGASLEAVRSKVSSQFVAYARELDGSEINDYSALKTRLEQYWETLEPVLRWSPEKRKAQGYSFLRDEIFPRRMAMLEVAGRIADINEQQLNTGNERAAELLDRFDTRLGLTLLAALALGLGMAAFSIRRILHLEGHAQQRYAEAAEARTQLASLSARLVEAQETERRSLSRELHDEVGQSLSAVLVELRNLLTGLGSRPPEQSRGQVELIKGLVEGAVGVIRNMALLLRPSMLDDLGLIPALKWQARETSKRTSMDVTVAAELEGEDLPDEYKTCIYRVVQEALHNCSRHSGATAVRIRVDRKAGTLAVSVQDDGRGFDPTQSKGLGLLGIEERVAQLGGVSDLHSSAGFGTILTVRIPYPAEPRKGTEKDHSEADSHSVSR